MRSDEIGLDCSDILSDCVILNHIESDLVILG